MSTSTKRVFLVVTVVLLVRAAFALAQLLTPIPKLVNGPAVSAWETTGNQTQLLAAQPALQFTSATVPGGADTIAVNDSVRYQRMTGFGAALTDSSAYVLTVDMSPSQRAALLQRVFSGTSGIGVNVLRVPIGATDFSTRNYTEDDLPAGATDPTLAHFSIVHDMRYMVPVLKQALTINPHIAIIASSWSAPAWMKTTGSLVGGTLIPTDLSVYAEYLTHFVSAYAAQGIPIFALTMQNEPDYSPPTYPGMTLTADQEAALAPLLAADLSAAGLHTRILGLDSDWIDTPFALTLVRSATASPYLAGTAFHCYSGNPSQQLIVEAAAPAKAIYETECSGVASDPGFADNLIKGTEGLVIDGVRDWSKTVMLWNLVLDQNFGPRNGGCQNCVPNVTVNSNTGAATYNVEHYALGQVSAFVKPGAYRVASTASAGPLQSVAFRDPDGADVLLVLNTSSASDTFDVESHGFSFEAILPAASVETFTW